MQSELLIIRSGRRPCLLMKASNGRLHSSTFLCQPSCDIIDNMHNFSSDPCPSCSTSTVTSPGTQGLPQGMGQNQNCTVLWPSGALHNSRGRKAWPLFKAGLHTFPCLPTHIIKIYHGQADCSSQRMCSREFDIHMFFR